MQKVQVVGLVASLPPFAFPSILRNMHFRFQCTGAATVSAITQANLLQLAMVFANGATTGYRFFGAVRVKRVMMCDVSLANKIAFVWLGSQSATGGWQAEKQLMSVGSTTQNARIDTVPPPNSAAAWWIGTQTNTQVFGLYPAGTDTFVDVWLDVQIGYGNTGSNTTTNSAPALGVFFLPLDGPGATPNFVSTIAGASLN